MRENFPRVISIEMVYEGGYSNDAHDPGGVTLNGIIQRVDDAYRRRKGLPVRPLTRSMLGTPAWNAERDDILRIQYWNAVRGDELPPGVDLVMMDGALNSGPYQAIIWLQRALGCADVDGHFGESTMDALEAHPDHDALIASILSRRLGMLHNLSTWQYFGRGWQARVDNVRSIGQAWAIMAVGQGFGAIEPQPVEVYTFGGHAKAYASDVEQPAFSPESGMVSAGSSGGLGAMLQLVKEQLAPYAYSSHMLMQVMMWLTIACAVVAAGGAIYSWWAARKQSRARAAINGEIAISHFDEGGAPVPATGAA